MISSTSSPDRTPRPDLVAAAGQSAQKAPGQRPDRISTESAAFLKSELQRQPETRPEVVERAKALAADPKYPPVEVARHVAAQILAAPDLSEDQS
ncbi:MAG TPA: hypothetical protein VHE61_00805 [Opitutaceae bacterium]|nr:hypothetical protein [Opitutaceae bacterium]